MCGPVTIRCATASDVVELADRVAAGGLDDDQTRDGLMSWCHCAPDVAAQRTRENMTAKIAALAGCAPGEMWSVPFVIVAEGAVIGRQDLRSLSVDPLVVGSGSWIVNTHRGRGYGTFARCAALAAVFAAGAVRAETNWKPRNAASRAVSVRLGYQLGELTSITDPFSGVDHVVQTAAVTPEVFAPVAPVEVRGVPRLRVR